MLQKGPICCFVASWSKNSDWNYSGVQLSARPWIEGGSLQWHFHSCPRKHKDFISNPCGMHGWWLVPPLKRGLYDNVSHNFLHGWFVLNPLTGDRLPHSPPSHHCHRLLWTLSSSFLFIFLLCRFLLVMGEENKVKQKNKKNNIGVTFRLT